MTEETTTSPAGIEILVVEDSPTQAAQLQYLLEQNGYAVTVAANGRLALEVLQEHQPQLIVSDIVMPEMDGYALCLAIKSDKRLEDIPVLLVTALSDVRDVLKGLECGADNFIRKPYNEKNLLTRIDYLLMNRTLSQDKKVRMAMEIYLCGQRYFITADRQQILDQLISVYEEAVQMNAELETRQQALAHSYQTLTGLFHIADGLNHATSEQEVVEKAVEHAMELPEIRAGWIMLCNGENSFRLAAARNLPPALALPGAMQGDCLCRQQLLSGSLDSADNIHDCERLGRLQTGEDVIKSHISIPVMSGDSPLGIMNLLLTEPRPFDGRELQTLHGIGSQIAVALMRARLHEHLENLVEQRTAALTAEIAERKRIEWEQARLVAILDMTPDFVGTAQPDGRPIYINRAGRQMLGYDIGETALPSILYDIHPEGVAKLLRDEGIPHAIKHGSWSGETALLRSDGHEIPVSQVIISHQNASGTVEYLSTIARDITQLKNNEKRIMRLNRVYAVLSGINTAIVHIHNRAQLLAAACQIATDAGGFKLAWIGMADPETNTIKPITYSGDSEKYLKTLEISTQPDAPEEQYPVVLAYREKRGIVCNDIAAEPTAAHWRQRALERDFQSLAAFPLWEEDSAVGVFALYAGEAGFFDQEELKLLMEVSGDIAYALKNIEKERQLTHLAFYDKVTNLPNRSLLYDRLSQSLPHAAQQNKKLAVLLLDIDRFKFINDSLGYQAGDALLKKVADRLAAIEDARKTVARGIGDEFTIMIPAIEDITDIAKFITESILPALTNPFTIAGEELRITAKIGGAIYPDDADNAETLLKYAEVALDKAKRSMNAFLFYAPDMNASVAKTLIIENKLRKAIERHEFLLHYQPKLDLASGRICGMEALIRWQDPETGLVPPLEFIPILEETGMILEVGRWVIETVCGQCRQWKDKGVTVFPVAVNVSSLQLTQQGFVDEVRGLLAAYGIEGSCIEFEITESVIMKEVSASIGKLKALRELGSEIAIDDFGTGYSSLSYLTRLPLSRLKIDKSFVNEMTETADSLAIVSSVITLAHGLNLKVTAEGVETEEQLKLLKLLKCNEIQGYIAHRPLPIEKLEEVLQYSDTAL